MLTTLTEQVQVAPILGDSYSFGTNGDRALGGLCTNSLVPAFGVKYKNNVGGALTNLAVQYTGETWRVASNNRSDQLNFQYSLDASGIDDESATWVNFDGLDYTNPGQASGSGSSSTLSSNIRYHFWNRYSCRWNNLF